MLTACNDLNLSPLNVITDADVFKNESGINSYMARLYGELPIEDFNYKIDIKTTQNPSMGNWSGEVLQNVGGYHVSPDGGKLGWWGYASVRNANYFLEMFPLYKDNFSEEKSNHFLGEAYFVRAYYYFAMAKRYGGIPIIDKLQSYPEQSLDELKVPRDKELDVYNFIATDLDEAIRLLPEESIQNGRANKGVAYALKSRAMLYAASIAKYGTIQLDGLLGIPADEASRLYQLSYDASLEVAKRYSLYNKFSDASENYWKLFLDKESPENIFVKSFYYPNITHNWDVFNIPHQMVGPAGYGSSLNPTLELVEMFGENKGNGMEFVIEKNGQPVRFNKPSDLFDNVDSRLRGSVILPGDEFKGEIIDIQKGLYTTYPNGELFTSADWNKTYTGDKGEVHITGKSGIGNSESTTTGFHIRKYQNPDMENSMIVTSRSEQHWIDIRYAEIILNRAEAAFELGEKGDALNAINEIRKRAGAKLFTLDNLTIELIQTERRIELAFENQSYWDIRRWRIAAIEINNKTYTSLAPYYIYDEEKYIFKREPVGSSYSFDPKVYYLQIPNNEIIKNELLEQNPGY